jgi:hypothetical protein
MDPSRFVPGLIVNNGKSNNTHFLSPFSVPTPPEVTSPYDPSKILKQVRVEMAASVSPKDVFPGFMGEQQTPVKRRGRKKISTESWYPEYRKQRLKLAAARFREKKRVVHKKANDQ